MNTTTDILRFLDGSLGVEDEAELLHRLSVSPERRETLRSYLQQAEMFERDRLAINVPYTAEQKLWARLGEMMPPPPAPQAFTSAATTAVTQVATQPRVSSWLAISAVALLGLLVGFGSGFFAGKETVTAPTAMVLPHGTSQALALTSPLESTNTSSSSELSQSKVTRNTSASVNHNASRSFVHRVSSGTSEAPHIEGSTSLNVALHDVANPSANNSISESSRTLETQSVSVAPAIALNVDGLHIKDPRNEGAYQYNPLRNDFKPAKSFIQRFEFMFAEGFGKQYPDNGATTVSFPVVTNSSVSAFYQVFEQENLYVGASFGTANMSKKELRKVTVIDPLGYAAISNVTHVQATWLGGMLQYRLPLSEKFALTASTGFSGSTIGFIVSGEIGSHIDLTDQVGLALGFRMTNLSYNLTNEMNDILNNPVDKKSIGFQDDVKGQLSSQNYELTAGMYFHF